MPTPPSPLLDLINKVVAHVLTEPAVLNQQLEANDIVQTVYLRYVERASQQQPHSSSLGYQLKVLQSLTHDVIRGYARR